MLAVLAAIAGCQTAETVDYEHPESIAFFKTKALRVEPYMIGDTRAVITIKRSDHQHAIVWLSLFAKSPPATLTVLDGFLAGPAKQDRQVRGELTNLVVRAADWHEFGDLWKFNAKMFAAAPTATLEKLALSQAVTVNVGIQQGTESKRINFKCDRVTRRYAVTR